MMEVEKREVKIKRHEKEKSSTLKNVIRRPKPISFNVSKFFLPEKRGRRNVRIPHFLLGGNISDPLNLNSLNSENEAETNNDDDDPVQSIEDNENKVELIIPPNICDPLNLLSPVDKTEYELQLTCNANLKKKRQRKRYKSGSEFHPMKTRKKVAFANKPGSSPSKATEAEAAYDSNVSKESEDDEMTDPSWEIKNIEKNAQKDPTRISPVLGKASCSGDDVKPSTSTSTSIDKTVSAETVVVVQEKLPDESKKSESVDLQAKVVKNVRCQYGNYNRYFGFESLNKNMDVRLKIFQRNLHLFKNKDVLDIGCNVGLMTLAVAKLLSPKTITGVDIDKKLINIARNKLKKYVAVPNEMIESDLTTETVKRHRTECFPMSFPTCYGNLSASFQKIQKKVQTPQTLMSTPQTPQNETQNLRIPENVSFEEMNYVPKDEQSSRESGKYDLILCLSVTKWIHLNYGDHGVKLTFKKIFSQLRPGGKLILELQNWPSYKKKKKMTEQIYENYKNINFSPSNFADYLLSQEVGFSHYYTLGVTQHLSKGFRRPIFLFVKGEFTPREAHKWSDVYFPATTPYRRPMVYYAQNLMNKYAPLPSWLSPMPSPFPYSRPSRTPNSGTPYYNPQQSDYLPSYDEFPRTSFAFMSPSSHSNTSSPKSPSSSKRSVDEEQHSPSASRNHLYHLGDSMTENADSL